MQTAETPATHLIAWIVLSVGAIFSAPLVLGFPGDIGAKVLSMIVFWIFSVISVRMDLSHPFVWLGGTFLLYSISGPLLLDLGLHPYPVWSGFLIEELDFAFAMDLQYLAIVVMFAMIGPRRMRFDPVLRDNRFEALFHGVTLVLPVALLISAIGIGEVISQGFTQKIDVILYGSWATRLGFGLNMTATCAAVYLLRHFVHGKALSAYVTIALFLALGVVVVTVVGERNFLFRFLVIALFAIHIAHRKISFGMFMLLGVAASVMIAVMGGLKMAAVSDQVLGPNSMTIEELVGLSKIIENPSIVNDPTPLQYAKILLVLTLGNEYMTAGNNLAMVVTRVPYEFPFQNGWTLINDVARGLQPGFLVRNEANNTTFIYNRLMFPENSERGGGQGFSLVGTGYFNFGTMGVIMIMALFGWAVRGAYRWAAKSPFGLVFFLGFIPIAIASARGDLSGPISQSLKHVLVPLVAMMLVSHFITNRARARGFVGAE